MTLKWEDLLDTEMPAFSHAQMSRPGLQCDQCGRFAKFAGDRHYYNGEFNCYSYDVNCSKCGLVTVECV